ncbi:unnamed protein product [Meloidogyne enterolobii]|uniref:Uncharacterized protein n=1 Tax=Meloidogyne enterolobii TaxID=390850 RepID=A0ACB1AZS4_MELEN
MMCKQRNNETVREFMTRLVPLVRATFENETEAQKQAKIREEFLERLRPNISFLIRIVGSAKDLDELYAKAQEIEVLTATNESFSLDNPRGLANSINIIQNPKLPETNINSWVRNPNQNNQYQSSSTNINHHQPIFSLREFKPYIFMSDVELHTDHKPLAYLLKKAEAHPHLARWLIELQSYQIKIVHIAGKQNSLADALSRINEEEPEKVGNLKELEDIAEFPVCLAIKPSKTIKGNHLQ